MVKRAKTSVSIDPALMKRVAHTCIEMDIGHSEAMELALGAWLESPSKVDGGIRDANNPRTNWSIDTAGERNTLIPSPQFIGKLAELLGSVPESSLPAVEECILQVAKSAIGLPGVSQQHAKRRTDSRHAARIEPEPLEDLPGMDTSHPPKPQKVG